MELRTIRIFVMVAKYLSFSKVADNMFLSQSSISKYISSLERELGHELFFRNTKSVSLTEFGREFLPHAQTLLAEEDRTKLFLSNYNTQQVNKFYTLGVAASLAYAPADRMLFQLVLAVERLKAEYPDVLLRLKYVPDDQLFPMLGEATIDLALFNTCKENVKWMMPDALETIILLNQRNYLLYPAGWGRFSTLEEISPHVRCILLAPDPAPRALTSRLCLAIEANPTILLCSHWSEMFIELLYQQAAGIVPGNLLPLAKHCNINSFDLDDRFLSCINLAWSKNNKSSRLFAIRDVLKEVLSLEQEDEIFTA